MRPCKHLDFSVKTYGEACELVEVKSLSIPVFYWKRKNPPYEGAPVNVQFCGQGRGRINGIFQCYNAGEMPCYEPLSRAPRCSDCGLPRETCSIKNCEWLRAKVSEAKGDES